MSANSTRNLSLFHIRLSLVPSFIPFLALLLLFTPLFAQPAPSADELWLKITSTGGRKRLSLAISQFRAAKETGPDSPARLADVQAVFEADLRFSLYFTFETPESGAYFRFETDPRKIDLKGWSTTGAEVLICGDLTQKRTGPSLELRLYDLATGRRIASKAYAFKPDFRWLAHEMADDVIKLLTGEDGVSRTRIAFSQTTAPGDKELALVDYDGAGHRVLTSGGNVKLFPDWSPDGRLLAYCAYGKTSLNIHTIDVASGTKKVLSERTGLNTTPAYSPDGRQLCVSLSHEGTSDLYLMSPDGRNLRRLVSGPGIEISPTWSPTGRQLAFVSDRTGVPQIYVVNVDGTDLRRLTFEGSYNTSPAWSPKGDLIAFVQRQSNGSNQICVTNITGDTYVRLTSRGNNEDPVWSPDGLHIAFASNRTGTTEIYLMDWNGANQTQLTRFGGAYSPAWSPRLRQ